MHSPLKVGHIIREEWLNILRDRRLFAILLLVPLLYTALFGYLYSHQRVTEMSTVIYDGDNTQISRQIIQSFDQSDSFAVTRQVRSEGDVQQAIERGDAKIGVIIPNDFSMRLKHGENIPLLTFIDGSNMLISNAASRAANQVVSTLGFAASTYKLQQQGLNSDQIASTFAPIPFRARILYNPTFNYSYFLVYGLVGAILQQVLLLGISLTVTRDKELGAWERFTEWRTMPWRIAYAKTAPYFLIGMVNIMTVFSLCLYGYHLPFRGEILSVITLGTTFTISLLGIGYLASLFSGNQVGATQITMLIAVPSFLLSGFTWPFEAMPHGLYIAGHLLPLTYFLDAVREIFIKGNGFESIWRDCITLGLMGVVCYFAALLATPFILKGKKTDPHMEHDSLSASPL